MRKRAHNCKHAFQLATYYKTCKFVAFYNSNYVLNYFPLFDITGYETLISTTYSKYYLSDGR